MREELNQFLAAAFKGGWSYGEECGDKCIDWTLTYAQVGWVQSNPGLEAVVQSSPSRLSRACQFRGQGAGCGTQGCGCCMVGPRGSVSSVLCLSCCPHLSSEVMLLGKCVCAGSLPELGPISQLQGQQSVCALLLVTALLLCCAQFFSESMPRGAYLQFYWNDAPVNDGNYIHPIPLQMLVAAKGERAKCARSHVPLHNTPP